MKFIKTVLAGCVSLLAMTAHAQADFIITPIAFALFAGPLGGALSFAAIYTGLQIAAFAAVVGAQIATAARGRQKIDPGEMKNTFQEAESSEFNAVGRVRLGGLKAFGNTKANVIYRLIWHVKGPMVAIEEYFLGGFEITVEDNGDVSSPPWARTGGSYANIQSKVGDGTETAWSALMSAFPSLWTSAHRCRGIFQSLVQFTVPSLSSEAGNKKFQKLYQGGAPDLEITARVGKVYDPREVGQDADDPETWMWTDNGILCAVHIMRHYPDLTSADFDWDFIADEADRADVLVATKSGTEPRARCWGVWPSEAQRSDVMQQVLDSIGAEVVLNNDGLIQVRLIDDDPVSQLTLTDDHITEFDWKSGPEAVERPNVCRLKYYSPERAYDMGEIDLTGIAWARVQDEIDRYGEKVFDIELPFCPSASQAQRIARRLFLLARGDAGAIRTNMVGLAAWGKTYLTIHDGAEEMLCHISPPRIDDEAGQVDIPYVVWPPELIDAPWNTATMEADPPIEAPVMQQESELPTPAQPAAHTQIIYPDTSRELRLRFTGVSGGSTAEATVRSYSGGNPNPWASLTETNIGAYWLGYAALNYEGSDGDFRVRFFNADGEGSYWSPYLEARPVAVDNSKPATPTITGNMSGPNVLDTDLTSDAFNGAYYVFEERRTVFPANPTTGLGPWSQYGTGHFRPGTTYNATPTIPTGTQTGNPALNEYRVRVFSSNDTASDPDVIQVYYSE